MYSPRDENEEQQQLDSPANSVLTNFSLMCSVSKQSCYDLLYSVFGMFLIVIICKAIKIFKKYMQD